MSKPYPIPRELEWMFPDGQPIRTGHLNFMAYMSYEDMEAVTESTKRIQDAYNELQAELIAEVMIPLGDPSMLTVILDRLSDAAKEMAAILRK
jgi:hypothetical protein